MAENKKNDRDHLNDHIIEWAPLINYHVNSMRDSLPPHIDHEDLYSAGMTGLIDAFHKYDPKRGANFNTYASQRIKGKMLDHITAGGPSAVDNYHYKQAKAFMGSQPKEQAAPAPMEQAPIKKPE
jgi:RNA polymerase sigma factor (sigma-70 family)